MQLSSLMVIQAFLMSVIIIDATFTVKCQFPLTRIESNHACDATFITEGTYFITMFSVCDHTCQATCIEQAHHTCCKNIAPLLAPCKIFLKETMMTIIVAEDILRVAIVSDLVRIVRIFNVENCTRTDF